MDEIRLINADALKEDLFIKFGNQLPNGLLDEIDNAPTVAVNCNDCDGYEAGYSAGLHDSERPQGKWIKEYKDFKCSLCGKIAYSWNNHGTYIQIKSDFCPHCGADMRGGADE